MSFYEAFGGLGFQTGSGLHPHLDPASSWYYGVKGFFCSTEFRSYVYIYIYIYICAFPVYLRIERDPIRIS